MSATTRGDVAASLLDLVRKDARRKSRRKALGKVIGALFTAVLSAAANGLYLMAAVGIIHDHWIPQCPTVGYWWAATIAFWLRALAGDQPGAVVR